MSPLAKQEKVALLKLAREAIVRKIKHGLDDIQAVDDPNLQVPAGAFVTLHRGGELRGCIGRIGAEAPLFAVIQEMAVAAATHDPRFPHVQAEEIDGLSLEISVLSGMQTCSDISQIEVGKHGLMITSEWNSGLLLPQVATEWGMDRETFLSHTCMKAGLPADFWKYGSPKIEMFSAEVFSEEDLHS